MNKSVELIDFNKYFESYFSIDSIKKKFKKEEISNQTDLVKKIEALIEKYTMLVNTDMGKGAKDYVVADKKLARSIYKLFTTYEQQIKEKAVRDFAKAFSDYLDNNVWSKDGDTYTTYGAEGGDVYEAFNKCLKQFLSKEEVR